MALGITTDHALSTADASRFWSSVRVGDGCWEWQGFRDQKGYGRFRPEGARRGLRFVAHRVSYTLERGDVPRGLFVCHHCDNPPCVRPSHLYAGTAQDNARDRSARGRAGAWRHPESVPRGELAGNARLSNADVAEMRAAYRAGRSVLEIASTFGTVVAVARAALRGETYSCVSGAVAAAPERAGLTSRQREVVSIIEGHLRARGVPPTLREIGGAMGITSTNGVADHLRALERKGVVRLVGKARGIMLCHHDASAAVGQFVSAIVSRAQQTPEWAAALTEGIARLTELREWTAPSRSVA